MSVLFIGKRFYTNRDALRERFGRIRQLPWHWARAGVPTELLLIDYHTREVERHADGPLNILSVPALSSANMRQFVSEVMKRKISDDRSRVIIASGDCYVGLMGYLIARSQRARFVFDVYDKYDEFTGYRRLPGFDPLSFLLQRADSCLFASRTLMKSIGISPCSDYLVPNGVDTQKFCPMNMLECRRALGLPERTSLVGYFGSMEPERGVDDLINAVKILRDEGMDLELLLGGKLRPDIDSNQPSIRYLGNLQFDNMPRILASCDILAMPYRNSPFLDMASSCKISEYISSGRPIVATRTPNLMANFPDQAGVLEDLLVNPGDVAGIVRSIRAQLILRRIVELPGRMSWESISTDLADYLQIGKSL